MKGILVFNKFYTDSGMAYIESRLKEEFKALGAEVTAASDYVFLESGQKEQDKIDFAFFFDKDTALAKHLEARGIRVFNNSVTTEICDDKALTAIEAQKAGVKLPKTVLAPLIYDGKEADGKKFLSFVEAQLGAYPIVVKHRRGSQGKQVFLARNRSELEELFDRNKYIPHLYQEYVGDTDGEDIRVYVIGKKPVLCAARRNTTDFRSNVSLGGTMAKAAMDEELFEAARSLAEILSLEYGSVDFIKDSKYGYVFIEANSCVYIMTPEKELNVNLARAAAEYILSETEKPQ